MYTIGLSFAALYLGFGALLFVMQRSFIYFPSAPVNHGYEEVVFENEGETSKTLLLNKGNKRAILYFGGNAESVAFNATEFEGQFPGYSVYLVNYRGYGGSSGNPSESALYSDALYIYDTLSPGYASISIIGRSLGSGIATYIASMRNVEKLILVTPFDSIQSVAQKQYPFYPMSVLLKDKYNSAQRASVIHANVLILAAEKDRVIGRAHTENLIKAFDKDRPRVVFIEGADHNDISNFPGYYRSINDFLKIENKQQIPK